MEMVLVGSGISALAVFCLLEANVVGRRGKCKTKAGEM